MNNCTNTVLYSFWRSSCAWRVRIALNLKEIPYQIKAVDLSKGEQQADEIRKMNPMKQIPFLLIDGSCLRGSLNIMYYLEETRNSNPLMPEDAKSRANVREICDIICSGIQPLQNLSVINKLGEGKQLEWAQHWIQHGFIALEELLSSLSGKYCVGDKITLADCFLVPQVSNAERFKVAMNQFPTISRISSQCNIHPAFIKAHFSNQPDCPSNES